MVISEAVRMLQRDLSQLFSARLRSLVAYGDSSGPERAPIATLAVVDGLTADDLRACADRVAAWHDAGLATPLLVGVHEFGRSLDVFPYEFGAILADHVVVCGESPFEGLRVDSAHLRHACEIQARGHLLHLREAYIETRGRSDALADLITRSAAPLTTLVRSVARLAGDGGGDARSAAAIVERAAGAPSGSLSEIVKWSSGEQISSEEARRLFPDYLDAVERLTQFIDQWRGNVL
jgi:hypothetical protein